MVTRGLRDCFDLNFYILYFVYNFVIQKLRYIQIWRTEKRFNLV